MVCVFKRHPPPTDSKQLRRMALSKPVNTVQQLLFKITSDGSLRGCTTTDKGDLFSVYDFITKVCKKTDSGAYARQQWLRMQKPSFEHSESMRTLVTLCHNLVLTGSGGRTTPCTDIRGLQRLLTILGSKVSEEYRALISDTFLRYTAGDRTMIAEIEAYASAAVTASDVTMSDAIEEVTRSLNMVSFKSILPTAEDVRVTYLDDAPYLWAVDLTMAVTGKSRDVSGCTLRNIKPQVFDSMKIIERNLPENGGKNTKLVLFDHSLELVMVLPGETAKNVRVQVCDLLKRFFAGDQTLHAQIDANATSTAPINVLARAAMPPNKKSRSEIDYTELEVRRKLICDSYETHSKIVGGNVSTDARAEYEGAMLSIVRQINAIATKKPQIRRQVDVEYIYCFESNRRLGYVKLGRTDNIHRRLTELNVGRGDDPLVHRCSARTLDSVRDERLTHDHFVEFHDVKEFYNLTAASASDYFNQVIEPHFLLESGATA